MIDKNKNKIPPDTTFIGQHWTKRQILAVWEKGIIVPGKDPKIERKDVCGATIIWHHHGSRKVKTGWEVDHIVADSKGGTDDISNLRPLQWENNVSKNNHELICKVKE